MILHIPHSRIKIPNEYQKILNISKDDINILTDWYTDELFSHKDATRLVAPYSRLFCDMERFRDNNKEVNYKTGQGVVYTKGYNNSIIREEDNEYEEEIKRKFYDSFHKTLSNNINTHLGMFGPVIIIDCHSFSEGSIGIENIENDEYPDVCIGHNDTNKPKFLNELKEYIEKLGYKVKLNSPFKGTLVPQHFENNTDVTGLMLEINRKLYLTDNYKKSKTFDKTKDDINLILNHINSLKEV